MADRTTSPPRWPLWAGLAAALGVLVLVVEVVPRAAEAAALFGAWRSETARLGAADPAERARLEAEQDRLAGASADALVALPASGELSVVLETVQAAADSAGVVVTALEPGAAREEPGFERVPLRVGVRGGGNGVGRFVSELERAPVLLKVRTLAVAGPGLGPGPVTADVDVEALRLGGGGGG